MLIDLIEAGIFRLSNYASCHLILVIFISLLPPSSCIDGHRYDRLDSPRYKPEVKYSFLLMGMKSASDIRNFHDSVFCLCCLRGYVRSDTCYVSIIIHRVHESLHTLRCVAVFNRPGRPNLDARNAADGVSSENHSDDAWTES